ncbi:hypothetical protein BJ166DRAFT_307453 [Pestalotiopsis sp. NC0098]|nr:hypothetical protein BJ166DRAFT_307453 [Pestalotiopsis sp. NC0098]
MKSKVAKTSRGGSNQSTSQSFIDAYLARRKREEINKLMEMLEGCLDSLDVTAHAHGAGNSSQRCNSSHSSSSTGSNTGAPQKPARQKRALDRDSFDESDPSRDGNDQDKRGGKRSRISTSPALKLACPFFKRDPTKYKDRQACTGPGYTSISRLKEHIYRAHRQPDNKCNRCCEIFSGSDQLEEHQRADVPCKVSQDKSTDGITESQYFKLRKKPIGKADDPERWKEVYLTIFPKATVVPSPYYEYEDTNRVPSYTQDGMKLLEEELLAGVRNDLEDRFEQFADETRESLVQIVKGRFKQITDQWSDKQKKPEISLTQVDVQPELFQFDMPTFEDFDFESFLCDSNMNYNNGDIFAEPSGGGFLYSSDVSDSAYGSMDSPKSPRKVGV